MNNSPLKICCGYRVLLSAPSLPAIDFTVFVRFIPFYLHQGKLGCQDLLTQNKPLSLSWLSPSRAGLQSVPRLHLPRKEAAGFYMPLSIPLMMQVDQLMNLQRTKSVTCAWSDTCPLSILLPKASVGAPNSSCSLTKKHSPLISLQHTVAPLVSAQVAVLGPEVWQACAWLNTTYKFKLKCKTCFSIYFLTVFITAHYISKKQNINIVNPQGYKAPKNLRN